MIPFAYERAADARAAVAALAADPDARFIAGGTNLVDLMKEGVERPRRLVDVSRLPGLDRVEALPGGGLRIGALARNSDLAAHPLVRARYPVLSQALLAGASGQLRNKATTGGNLLQRTRCPYFTDPAMPCNKREPGSGCGAIGGFDRIHAVLGASGRCVATHPSDMAVAMAALGATVRTLGPRGEREIALVDFHRLPGETPEVETALERSELVTAVDLPPLPFAANRSRYRKVRERASYAFAAVSVAAALDVEGGRVRRARVALGGVAHKPWRASLAERALEGAPATPESFARAAEAELAAARPGTHNAFKIPLARRVLARTLEDLARQA